jgi:hypothetical protein
MPSQVFRLARQRTKVKRDDYRMTAMVGWMNARLSLADPRRFPSFDKAFPGLAEKPEGDDKGPGMDELLAAFTAAGVKVEEKT